jgi:serine/threonine-protein kinase
MGPRPEAQPAPGPRSGAITFEALAEIAVGATARVDLCRVLQPHPRAGQLLAVKRLHPHIAEDPTFANQFFDEAWMTASLRHPNVVEVAGWGTDEQGTYLAVELVQGVSLLRLMKTIFETGEAFTERMVVYIASRICKGLAAAHALTAPNGELLHLVHRDLTPGNILVGFNGEVKIADFGMAKAKQRLTKTLTGMRKGEPTYMAPEQAQRDDIDARADLFSLGVMLFELFAGRRPWIAKSDFDMVQITLREPPADLRELRPKIDKELVNVVNRCLEKDPASRFQSANEIAARFDEWLSVHGYQDGNEEALGRFVRRNAMRQMRWFERAIAGEMSPQKVGREAPPRVPTYTEHTGRPPLPTDERADTGSSTAKQLPPPPPAPSTVGPQAAPNPAAPLAAPRPIVPSRTPSAPLDPRAARAQNAVQQLKKLAPPVEPPRARKKVPSLDEDEDGDATDVELRYNPGGVAAPRELPRLVGEDDDETGEELPTLVQKDDPQIKALRAEVRAKNAKPPYVSPGAIVDEESDQRITEVKPEHRRGAVHDGAASGPKPRAAFGGAAPQGAAIADPESDLPTEPIKPGRKPPPAGHPADRPGAVRDQPADRSRDIRDDPTEAPTPIAVRGAPPQRSKGPPPRQVIPPSPDIPPRPFPAPQAAPAKIPPAPVPGRPKSIPAPPPPPTEARAERAARITARPPPPPSPVDPARVSQHDDVQVIDRAALQQVVLGSEESLIAEADRLAIEAVRRTEEAKAAQLRAERKAAAAKLASEAAMIAAEAVRLSRSAGLPVALKRLEEARQLEQAIQTGKLPVGDGSGPVRVGAPSVSTPPPAASATLMSGAPAASVPPSSFPISAPVSSFPAPQAVGVPASSSVAPAPYAPDQGGIVYPSVPPPAPPPSPMSITPPAASLPNGGARPSFAPPEPSGPHAVRPSFAPPEPTSAPMAMSQNAAPAAPFSQNPAPLAPAQRAPVVDPEAFQRSLKPSFLGAPGGAIAALAVIALLVVIVLVLLLAK